MPEVQTLGSSFSIWTMLKGGGNECAVERPQRKKTLMWMASSKQEDEAQMKVEIKLLHEI